LIGERTGYATGIACAIARRFFGGGLAAHHLALRIELFARGFRGGHVDLRHDLGAHAARTHERRQHLLDAIGIAFFEAVRELEHLVAHRGVAVGLWRRQQAASLIDHGNLRSREFRNAGRHEIRDRLHVLIVETAPGLDLQEHRRTARPPFAHERGLPRHGEVHAGALHVLQAGDGAGELSFERVLVARVLHERADAEARIARHGIHATAALRRPCDARRSRAAASCSAGTLMAPTPFSSL
jgi:hypothetical protein